MILFVFEGGRREIMLFRSIELLFFSNTTQHIVCSFDNNIYELYRQLKSLGEGADIVALMKERGKIESSFDVSAFSDIFLFFDLDIHTKNQTPDVCISQLTELLDFFDNETENGKLYVNYPMIESIYHTEKLPDSNYSDYSVLIYDCSIYKRLSRDFGPYGNLDHLYITKRQMSRPELVERARVNWIHLIQMNIDKSKFLCDATGQEDNLKEFISQLHILDNQVEKFITPRREISILNGFPLFLFDYFRPVSPRLQI